MKRLLITLFYIYACASLSVTAQTIKRSYKNQPLPQVLTDLNKAAKGAYNIFFIHEELQDFPITCTIRHQTLPEAVCTVIGFYPISMTLEGKNIFVEPIQKEKLRYTGCILDEENKPLAYANITLLSTDGKEVLGKGVSNQGGHFAIPSDADKGILRVTHVGYTPHQQACAIGSVGFIRMKPSNTFLNSVTVKPHKSLPSNIPIDKEYAKYAQQVCNWVWNMPQREFTLLKAPSALRKYDIVALAEYDSLGFGPTNRNYGYLIGAAMFGISRTLPYIANLKTDAFPIIHLHRTRLLLNSDSAAQKMSAICYPQYYDANSQRRDVMGIKVVKPDGQVRFIDTYPYLQPSFESNNVPKPDSIAIDGLCKGDILDIFYFTQTSAKRIPQYTYTFNFSKPYPTMNLKCRIACSGKTYLRYKYFNWNKPFDFGLSEDRMQREIRFDELIMMPTPDKPQSAMTICVQNRRHSMTGMFEKQGEGGIEQDRSLVREWNECYLNE